MESIIENLLDGTGWKLDPWRYDVVRCPYGSLIDQSEARCECCGELNPIVKSGVV